jgi:hypothetical protein
VACFNVEESSFTSKVWASEVSSRTRYIVYCSCKNVYFCVSVEVLPSVFFFAVEVCVFTCSLILAFSIHVCISLCIEQIFYLLQKLQSECCDNCVDQGSQSRDLRVASGPIPLTQTSNCSRSYGLMYSAFMKQKCFLSCVMKARRFVLFLDNKIQDAS